MNIIKERLKKDTPRGLVLLIDIVIVFITYVATNFILNSFYGRFDVDNIVIKLPLALAAYIVSFMIFKPHRGVIRQTGLKDAQNVLYSCLFASLVILLVTLLQRNNITPIELQPYLRFSYSIIVLHLLLTTVVMVSARVFYSKFYRTYVLSDRGHKRVMIYGAGDSGIITIGALQADTKLNVDVIGFIDDNPRKEGKKINGYRVYSPKSITEAFILKNRIDDIVISIQNIPRERLNEISKFLEKLPITIKIIPAASDWLNGKYIGKQIKTLRIDDLLGRKSIQLDNPIIEKEFEGKVVLITGAAGSIGSEIARQIATKNFKKLILVDQAESALYDVQQTMNSERKEHINYVVANIRNQQRMETIFKNEQPDVVYHAAAYKHVPLMEDNPYEAVTTNIYGTKVIADLSVAYGIHKFVMVSTDKAVNPTNVMGATKRVAEIYVSSLNELAKTNFIVTRFGNVLGSNGSVIPVFKRQIKKGGPLTVTHKDITRYFMTIPEACQLVLEASIMGKGGEIFVFDMGESIKIIDLAKRMIRLSGYDYPNEIDIKITGLRPGEKIFEELLANDENTVQTHHDKIMIAQVCRENLDLLQSYINEMCVYVYSTEDNPNNFELVRQIKRIVPEYKSQNSSYESLDQIEA